MSHIVERNLEFYEKKYRDMICYLQEPLEREYEPLVKRLEILGILMSQAGEFMTDVAYKIDEVIDIECQVKLSLLDVYSASTFNMMVKAKAKDWNRLKLGFERCSASATHQIDAIRTIISYEKEKMKIL